MSCIIIEDQPPAQRVLKKYINDLGTLELNGVFSDPIAALEFLRIENVDIIFLDIHLPKISGIDFLKILSPRPKVVLTTAFSDYAIESYELDVVDYLLKPFSFERFIKAVEKATASDGSRISETGKGSTEDEAKRVFIKSGGEYVNINFDEVLFIKSDGDYTSVFSNDDRHLISHPLRYWLEILPDQMFTQVHKSYIINVNKIKKVSAGQIYIGKEVIPIGRTYKEGFFNQFLKD